MNDNGTPEAVGLISMIGKHYSELLPDDASGCNWVTTLGDKPNCDTEKPYPF